MSTFKYLDCGIENERSANAQKRCGGSVGAKAQGWSDWQAVATQVQPAERLGRSNAGDYPTPPELDKRKPTGGVAGGLASLRLLTWGRVDFVKSLLSKPGSSLHKLYCANHFLKNASAFSIGRPTRLDSGLLNTVVVFLAGKTV